MQARIATNAYSVVIDDSDTYVVTVTIRVENEPDRRIMICLEGSVLVCEGEHGPDGWKGKIVTEIPP